MPWANGGGLTSELARSPIAGDRFDWRISIADVEQAGPFSSFIGHDRIITLLEGRGMELTFEAPYRKVLIARPLRPFAFSGDWGTQCRLLGGAVRDFNVIFDRETTKAEVTVLGPTRIPMRCGPPAGMQLLFVAKGTLAVSTGITEQTGVAVGAPALLLDAGHALIRDRTDDAGQIFLALPPGAAVLLVDLVTQRGPVAPCIGP
jgi:environmental stress-induced protein Ves